MSEPRDGDAVSRILAQWNRERPDLDVFAMGVIGRLRRCTQLLDQRLDQVFARFGLSAWEFDVLATLRRAGAPYRLTPTALFSWLMITSGTLTHRLRVLEDKGWICREDSAGDARSRPVRLTETGFALIEQALEAHLANEQALLRGLGTRACQTLDARLSALLQSLENG